MQLIPAINDGFWLCKHTWKRSRLNTFWCLLGCSIGDFGTIFMFQDERDASRKHSPLKPSKEALIIDTSDLTVSEVVTKVMALVKV